MSTSSPHDLIERHLAGTLSAEQTTQLEHLIRSEPSWARRYREAEDFARLMRQGLAGDAGAPREVRRAIAQAIRTEHAPAVVLGRVRPWMAVAATLLLGLGLYLLLPARGVRQAAYAHEPLPLKDLARSASIGLLGTVAERDGALAVEVTELLFGQPAGRRIEVPEGVAPGASIALFARVTDDGRIAAVDGRRGVVFLDRGQRWEGAELPAEAARRRVMSAGLERTVARATRDLEAFVASTDPALGRDPSSGHRFTPQVTARYLGRFAFDRVRAPLTRLLMARGKDPAVRNAGAEALVEADAVRACRGLLEQILEAPPIDLDPASADGRVVRACLELIGERGRDPALIEDLRAVAARFRAPVLREAARAAANALAQVR